MAQDEAAPSASEEQSKASAVWEQLRCKDSRLKSKADAVLQRSYGRRVTPDAPVIPKKKKVPPEWMRSLGMVPKRQKSETAEAVKVSENATETLEKEADNAESAGGTTMPGTDQTAKEKGASEADKEESRRIAAAALAAVRAGPSSIKKDQTVASSDESNPGGKAAEAEKRQAEMKSRSSSGLDDLLQQIQKNKKINILDKSKKDWGEFKDEKGLSEELEAYKKSGDKYLDKVAFLQRADFREYEKERDERLAYQAKRRQGVNYQDD